MGVGGDKEGADELAAVEPSEQVAAWEEHRDDEY